MGQAYRNISIPKEMQDTVRNILDRLKNLGYSDSVASFFEEACRKQINELLRTGLISPADVLIEKRESDGK